MTKEELKELIETGREIEFKYKGKDYSITYPDEASEINCNISFCEFYKDTFDCFTVDELWNGIYHDMKISDILLSLTEEDVWIYWFYIGIKNDKRGIKRIIETGREIEFYFEGKGYPITYYNDDRKDYISIIEFNKLETIHDASTAEEALNVKMDKKHTVEYMILNADQEIDIF